MELGTPPAWAGMLIGSVDVQSGSSARLELDVWAFGADKKRALVDHIEIDGDPADSKTWAKLDKHVGREWISEDGRALRLERVAVDSGDGNNTMHVYAWARRNPGFAMAVKGRDKLDTAEVISGPTWVEATIGGRKLKRGVRLWSIGTSLLKLELYGQLHLEKPVEGEDYPDGYVYLPVGTTDEWIKQLCAEELRTKKRRNGKLVREWVKVRDRNEALDNAVYARAVSVALGADRWKPQHWDKLIAVGRTAASRPVPDPSAKTAPKMPRPNVPRPPLPTRKSSFTKRSGSWLKPRRS